MDSRPDHQRRDLPELRSCCCAWATIPAAIVALYVLIGLWNLGESFSNQLRWNSTGSSNYTITVQNDAFAGACFTAGTHRIPVRNGKAIAEVSWLDDWTVERLFQRTRGCAFPSPFLSCSVEYDPTYGYPSKLITSQSFPGVVIEQCTRFSKISVQIDR